MKTIKINDLLKFGFQFIGRMPNQIEYLQTYSIKKGNKDLVNLRHLFKDINTGEKIILYMDINSRFSERGIISQLYQDELNFVSNDMIINTGGSKKKYHLINNDFNLFIQSLELWHSKIDFKVRNS
jgi:hypothetical protein